MEFVTAAMPVSLLAPIAVHYQPIVGLVTQRMVGCEALSRWHTASGELCGPGPFIASIENDFVHIRNELVTIVEGRLEVKVAGSRFVAEPGDEVFIPKGALHSIKNVHVTATRWLYGYD